MDIGFVRAEHVSSLADLLHEMSVHYNGENASRRDVVEANLTRNILGPDSDVRLVVAVASGVVVGFAAISILYPAPKERAQLFMKELYILSSRRGEGIGEALMVWVAQYAVQSNCVRFDWTVDETNLRALAFYRRIGATQQMDKLYFRFSGDQLLAFARGDRPAAPTQSAPAAATVARPERTWETDRLAVRPAVAEDARIVFEEYASDPGVARFMTWRPHESLAETLDFLRRCERAWADGSAFPWTLWVKEGGTLAGLLETRVNARSVDLGYALVQRWWRHGLMTEALTAVIHWAFSQPDLHRVWAVCDIENHRSARVLERVGLEQEGVLRRWLVHPNLGDTPRDCVCYSKVRPAG